MLQLSSRTGSPPTGTKDSRLSKRKARRPQKRRERVCVCVGRRMWERMGEEPREGGRSKGRGGRQLWTIAIAHRTLRQRGSVERVTTETRAGQRSRWRETMQLGTIGFGKERLKDSQHGGCKRRNDSLDGSESRAGSEARTGAGGPKMFSRQRIITRPSRDSISGEDWILLPCRPDFFYGIFPTT